MRSSRCVEGWLLRSRHLARHARFEHVFESVGAEVYRHLIETEFALDR